MIAIAVMLFASVSSLLEGKPSDKAWSVLQDALSNKSSDKRAHATHALGSIPNNARAQTLAEKGLTDPNADVRLAAANALGEMKATSARYRLREALKDREIKVVIAAANALYVLHDPEAYQVYYALLTGERKSSEGLLQSQLDTLRDRKQMEKLLLETGIGFVPFGGMGWEAWKTITQDDTAAVRAAAAEKLVTDPDPKAAQGLVKCIDDKKWQVRAAAVNALGRRGDPRMTETIVPLLFDENDTVRYQAAAAILVLSQPKRRK